jgi:hypothetical protein
MRGTVRADIVNTPAGLLTPALYAPPNLSLVNRKGINW